MKIRNGLVSNSSSSSFLLFFRKLPESVEELKNELFKEQEIFEHPYPEEGKQNHFSTYTVAETIFRDIQQAELLSDDAAAKEITYGFIREVDPSWNTWDVVIKDIRTKEEKTEEDRARIKEVWNIYDREHLDNAKKYLQEKRKTIPNHTKMVVLEYSDNDGPYYCALEHGGTFENIPHIKIPKH